MIRVLGTILAGLLGLAFGSFLNVCLSRWPEGESVVKPRSHCRNCGRTLEWWENVPMVSWIALRGRCRTCKAKISWRYPLVELAAGALWGYTVWRSFPNLLFPHAFTFYLDDAILSMVGTLVLCWILVALAVLDAEHLWLPDILTLSGIALGCLFFVSHLAMFLFFPLPIGVIGISSGIAWVVAKFVLGILAAAGLILLIRWTYWLVRRREGIGLGDAKLMAMLGAWLGLSGALLSFAIGILLGSMFALIVLAVPAARLESDTWLLSKLPLGTFLCIGGIISALWGQPIIAAYLRLVGLS
jgi:leader peptidase (prepilin peptidase) / N-methyltransferase